MMTKRTNAVTPAAGPPLGETDEAAYQTFELNEDEYEFYSQPVSQAGSWQDLTEAEDKKASHKVSLPALNDPIVRKQLSKQKLHYPIFLATMTVIQVLVLGYEFYLNFVKTGSVIQTNPFNYMIGPAAGIMTQTGARYLPCMKRNSGYDVDGLRTECMAGIIGDAAGTCSLAETCNFFNSPFETANPSQWYRFLTPIFLHAGIVHLLLNVSFQINVGFQLGISRLTPEREIGFIRIALIYFISGAGGFIFGASLSDIRTVSVGASGSLYGNAY
jgi:membrane associated rhomboid family serine protease